MRLILQYILFVFNDSVCLSDKVCPDELDKEYSIHWSRTKAGTESYAPCPRNNSGGQLLQTYAYTEKSLRILIAIAFNR